MEVQTLRILEWLDGLDDNEVVQGRLAKEVGVSLRKSMCLREKLLQEQLVKPGQSSCKTYCPGQ